MIDNFPTFDLNSDINRSVASFTKRYDTLLALGAKVRDEMTPITAFDMIADDDDYIVHSFRDSLRDVQKLLADRYTLAKNEYKRINLAQQVLAEKIDNLIDVDRRSGTTNPETNKYIIALTLDYNRLTREISRWNNRDLTDLRDDELLLAAFTQADFASRYYRTTIDLAIRHGRNPNVNEDSFTTLRKAMQSLLSTWGSEQQF